MDIQQLKFFITTAEYEHLSHASEVLNISQSSLSYSINSLEQELGVNLFDRIGRNIRLNKAGMAFIPYATEILRLSAEAKNVLNAKYGIKCTPIVIQSTPLSYYNNLFDMLYTAEQNIEIIPIGADTPPVLYDNLIHMKTDLCISSLELSERGLNCHILQSDQIIALVSQSHPLANETKITLEQLKDQSFISGATAISSVFLDTIAKTAGFDPKIQSKTSSHEETLYFIKKMPCIYLITKSVYKHIQNIFDCSEIQALELDVPLNTLHRKLYWRKKNNSPSVKRLCEILIAYFKDRNETV